MFEFANVWMFLLLPLPLLVIWLLPDYRESQDSVRVPFFKRLVTLSGEKPGKGAASLQRVWFQRIWVPLSWILLVAALAKPEWVGDAIEQNKSARDLMVAVDLSSSMEVKDFTAADGNKIARLDAVKEVLAEFAAQREGDRLGLIVFGDSPYLQAPFTDDHQTWISLLNETKIGMAGQSTMFGDAIGLAIKLFETSETENRVLIVLTDGNDTGSKVPPIEAAKVAADKDVTIYSIAIGDPQTQGEEALDLDVLNTIAEISGGGFYQALDRAQLERAYQAIGDLEPQQYQTLSYRPRISLHHYPLAILISGSMLFLVLMTFTAWRRKKLSSHV